MNTYNCVTKYSDKDGFKISEEIPLSSLTNSVLNFFAIMFSVIKYEPYFLHIILIISYSVLRGFGKQSITVSFFQFHIFEYCCFPQSLIF